MVRADRPVVGVDVVELVDAVGRRGAAGQEGGPGDRRDHRLGGPESPGRRRLARGRRGWASSPARRRAGGPSSSHRRVRGRRPERRGPTYALPSRLAGPSPRPRSAAAPDPPGQRQPAGARDRPYRSGRSRGMVEPIPMPPAGQWRVGVKRGPGPGRSLKKPAHRDRSATERPRSIAAPALSTTTTEASPDDRTQAATDGSAPAGGPSLGPAIAVLPAACAFHRRARGAADPPVRRDRPDPAPGARQGRPAPLRDRAARRAGGRRPAGGPRHRLAGS